MSLNVSVARSVSDINTNRWNNVIKQSDQGSIYHTTSWLTAIEDAFEFEPAYVIVELDGGIISLCPTYHTPLEVGPLRRLSSLPQGLGGPVLSSNRETGLDAVAEKLAAVMTYKTPISTLQMEGAESAMYQEQLQEHGYRTELLGKYVVPLDEWDGVLSRMSNHRRREIRKATDQQFQIHELDINEKTLSDLYEYYQNAVDAPGLSKSFLHALGNNLDDKLLLTAAEVDGGIRGYHLYIVDSLCGKLRNLITAVQESAYEYYPSQLLHRHGIQYAIDAGLSDYDMGGTKTDHRNGVASYKQQYGGHVEPILSFESGISEPVWHLYQLGKKAFSPKGIWISQ